MLKSGTKYAYVNNSGFGGLIYRYTGIFLTDLTFNGKFPGLELDRFMENLSNQNSWVPIQFCSNSGYELEQFPEIPSNRQFYNFEA